MFKGHVRTVLQTQNAERTYLSSPSLYPTIVSHLNLHHLIILIQLEVSSYAMPIETPPPNKNTYPRLPDLKLKEKCHMSKQVEAEKQDKATVKY